MDFKNQYTIPDLLTNESFLNYYFKKNEDDMLDWEDWVEEDAAHEQLAKDAFILLDRLSLKWDEAEIKKRFIELKQSLPDESETDIVALPTQPLRVSYGRKWAVAASILIISVLGIGIYLDKQAKNDYVFENTDPNKSTIYYLKDGTTVTLKGKSQIQVATDFNEATRTVTLNGEAFFEVAHNADKPFLVFTGNVITKVLGTSFSVKSPLLGQNTEGGSKSVEVEVVTGKVSVFKKDINTKKGEPLENGVVLTPNQKVTYLTENEHFVVGIVDKPVIMKEVEKQPEMIQFRFEETPLSEVISKLENAYGIQILLSNDKMNDCPMTANLTKQPLFGKLDLVCAILKANYEVQGTRILITGRGCE